MKKILLALLLLTTAIITKGQTTTTTAAQNDTAPGPAEQKLVTSLCEELGKIDITTIKTKEQAEAAFMNAFMSHADKLMELASEKGLDLEDDETSTKLGEQVALQLIKQKCQPFVKLATVMALDETEDATINTTSGAFKRIDNKGFNYIVITDGKGNEQSFLWLRQFPDSDKFMNGNTGLAGKKLTIKSQDIEVYVPAAKGYFKVKEITGIEIL